MMKIGIMGGTFDPIHNGHLKLGEAAYRTFHLDQVWFMPNGNPPHKTSCAPEGSAKDRAEMVKRAIAGISYFKVEEYEILREEVSYSYKSMEHFKRTYPEHQFYFIIGADSLFSIDDWMKPERLLASCIILAACRGTVDTHEKLEDQILYLKQKYNAKIEILPAPLMEISSHEIRTSLHEDKRKLKSCLPASALEYIETKHLYESE
ncbi:MAG: nicotinate-nucleotide adenylyltransferase [Lachnospiraceae bacterium]